MANNKRHRQRAITMLFSNRRGGRGGSGALRDTTGMAPERVFECKTCNRQFPSFQALGGHRASHKKPRLADGEAPIKPKVHGCSVCGLEFAVGQALGGHMRRHRVTTADSLEPKDIGKKAAAAAAGLALDLNAPALEEELDGGANLGLTIESPTEDFPR